MAGAPVTRSGQDSYAAIAEFYDHVTLYRERPDVDFFVDAARRSGGPVLELGSGTGRVLIPTARAGSSITGLDSSPSMLAICRDRLGREAPDVRSRATLLEGDMRAFDLGRRFALITLPFRPFQHLVTVEEQLGCLDCIRRHLAPDGRLILDLFNPSLEALTQPTGIETVEAEFAMPDGRTVQRGFRIVARDRAGQVNQVELYYDVTGPDGETVRLIQAFPMRYLFRFEAEHLLARAGFRVLEVYGGYDRQPFGASYPGELILEAAL
jgi:SAM-dependent methyltransferase